MTFSINNGFDLAEVLEKEVLLKSSNEKRECLLQGEEMLGHKIPTLHAKVFFHILVVPELLS